MKNIITILSTILFLIACEENPTVEKDISEISNIAELDSTTIQLGDTITLYFSDTDQDRYVHFFVAVEELGDYKMFAQSSNPEFEDDWSIDMFIPGYTGHFKRGEQTDSIEGNHTVIQMLDILGDYEVELSRDLYYLKQDTVKLVVSRDTTDNTEPNYYNQYYTLQENSTARFSEGGLSDEEFIEFSIPEGKRAKFSYWKFHEETSPWFTFTTEDGGDVLDDDNREEVWIFANAVMDSVVYFDQPAGTYRMRIDYSLGRDFTMNQAAYYLKYELEDTP